MHKINKKVNKVGDKMNAYPFQIPMINQNNYFYILKEIEKIKKQIKELEEQINIKNDNNYLKKDDNYYMI